MSSVPPKILRVLTFLTKRLAGTSIKWAVNGSTSLSLQGIRVTPKDIDILTDRVGAYKVAQLFQKYVVMGVGFRSSSRFKSHLGRLKIRGVQVEIMGNLRVLRKGRWSKILTPGVMRVKGVKVGKCMIPVVSLLAQRESGYLRGRLKEERIRNASASQKSGTSA